MERDQAENRAYATCQICRHEMAPGQGCEVSVVRCNSKEHERVKAGDELDFDPDMDEGDICHDCNAAFGHYHHYGCDAEACPSCHGQLIGCDCVLEFDEIE